MLVTARKLRPYFQAHTVVVLTNLPLKKTLQNVEASGCLTQWAIELSEFDIQYQPHRKVQGQAVADFLIKAEGIKDGEDQSSSSPSDDRTTWAECTWIAHVDRSSNKWASGAGIVLTSLNDQELQYSLRFDFKATNNEVEYQAILAGVSIVRFLGADGVVVRSDS